MSSTAPFAMAGGGGAAAPQRYFCHQCGITVVIPPSPASAELLCPLCNGGFIEEYDLPPNPNLGSLEALVPSLFSAPSPTTDLASLLAAIAPSAATRTTTSSIDAFNPLQSIMNHLDSIMVGNGANIQLVFEGSGGAGFPSGGDFGDYFLGSGLEQLIQQLAENDPNRYGTPPASKSVVDSLPDVKICEDLIKSDHGAQCAVCKDEFEIGDEVKQMPCKHMYHKDCILPWLELHNSCPVCRFELPTDDQDYESRKREGQGQGQGGEGGRAGMTGSMGMGGGMVGSSPRGADRSFTIQLPWPFRGVGGNSEGSGGSGSGGPGEPMEEDLD